MEVKRKIKSRRNPLYLHLNNLINRRDFFSVVLIFCACHHDLDAKILKRLLYRFYTTYLEFLNSQNCSDDFDERANNFDDVLSSIKSLCNNVPTMYRCIEYLFARYCDLKGGVNHE